MSSLVRRIDERAGRWGRLVLDAPPGNLLSLAMVADLDLALDRLAGERGLRWPTVESAGGEFSFGAQVQEHLPEPMREVSAVVLAHACLAARAMVRAQAEPLSIQLERQYLEGLLATHDATEGVRAWMEKRAPRWEDR